MAQPLFPVDRLPHMRFARGYIASSQSGRWVIALVFGSLLSPVSVSLAHAQILGQIEMRDSATADDYLCWSPVQARIRLATSQPADVSVTVKSVPLGPAGGQVQFMAATSAPITRATFTPVPELALTLPKDGGWVRFWLPAAEPPAEARMRLFVPSCRMGRAPSSSCRLWYACARMPRPLRPLNEPLSCEHSQLGKRSLALLVQRALRIITPRMMTLSAGASTPTLARR
jgi:hypothetical protein